MRIELPAVLVDGIAVGSPDTSLQIRNRDPEPGEVQVPVAGPIVLQVVPTNGAPVDLGALRVAISLYETDVYSPLTGFSADAGPGSAVTWLDTGAVEVVIVPVVEMPSLELVRVEVWASLVGGDEVYTTYEFTVEDMIPPASVTAAARGRGTVVATFDEPVDPDVATDPSRYALRVLTIPAYPASVVSATLSSAVEVMLELDDDLSLGADYELVVTGMADVWGNVSGELVAPFSTPMPTEFADRDFDLYRMMPQVNRDADLSGDMRKFLGIFQDVLNQLLCDIDRWPRIYDPRVAEEGFVDVMLESMGNPFVFEGMTLNDKRRLLVILNSLYRQKGTPQAITNGIRFFLGLESQVRAFNVDAWILGQDTLGETTVLGSSSEIAIYMFDVIVFVYLTDQQRDRILELVRILKPAHAILRAIVEPEEPVVIDHWQLGFSLLGSETILH